MSSSMFKDETIDNALLERLLDADFHEEVPSAALAQNEPFKEFPLTDIQRGYFMGRNPDIVLGGSSCQFYYEVDCDRLNVLQYQSAWQKVIQRHPMLRAIVLSVTGQKVLENVPSLVVPFHDLSLAENATSVIDAIRSRITQSTRPHDRWPLFDVEVSRLETGRYRIHLGFDLLIADQHSILTVMQEVATLYRNPDAILAPVDYSFREYVLHREHIESVEYSEAQAYWMSRLDALPLSPELPLLSPLHLVEKPKYQRITRHIEQKTWGRVKNLAADIGVTPSTILLALFSEALCYLSETQHFSLNMTMFNRQPVHPAIDKVVGDFTTNLLFAVDLRQKGSRREFIKKIQADLWRDIEHSSFSGIEVMAQLARKAGHLDPPLMPVVFTSTLSQVDTELFSSANTQLGTPIYHAAQTPQAILDNQLLEWEGQLQINWDITINALDIDIATTLLDHYTSLIEDLVNSEHSLDDNIVKAIDPEQCLIVPVLEAQPAYRRLTDMWLDTLEESVSQPALKTKSTTWTHRQLAERVSGIAYSLTQAGIVEGNKVCIAIEKSVDQIAVCLAVSVLGAVYVPIDIEQPEARIAKILLDLQPDAVVVANNGLKNSGDKSQLMLNAHAAAAEATLFLDVSDIPNRDYKELFAYPEAVADSLAYIIYTSGSTGVPKGVCIHHQAAINTCLDINRRFGLNAEDCMFGLSALHFDLSVFDIFAILGIGASIALPDPDELQNPKHWAEICRQCRVTLWNSVPALWSLMVGYLRINDTGELLSIRVAMLSGDWIPLSLVPETRSVFPKIDFYSLGGATEASIWSIYYPIQQLDQKWSSIPYGKGLGGQQVFVLNKALELVPPGKTGDIYIAGKGLATGYYQDPDKTEQHFLTHPRTGLALYRTGDLGCYYHDGNIEFKGRSDSQLKVNGYRVELGEIARAIIDFSTVLDAVVVPVDRSGKTQLVAFVKVDETAASCSADATQNPDQSSTDWRDLSLLKKHLQTQLPAYMLPDQWQVVSQYPLTSNGKLDVSALKRMIPAASTGSITSQLKVNPQQNTVEMETSGKASSPLVGLPESPHLAEKDALSHEVLTIVAQVLKVDRVGLDDNLVSLGASSVELIALASEIENFAGQRPPLPELARAVQLADLVALVRELMPSGGYSAPLYPGENSFRRYLEKTPLITDAESRRLFKTSVLPPQFSGEVVSLHDDSTPVNKRQSWRSFSAQPTSLDQLSQMLRPLRQYYVEGQKKHHYASAGGQYPIEIYLFNDAEKIQGLKPGRYFYDAQIHALKACGAAKSAQVFSALSGRNSDWLKDAHFLICMVIRMDTIVPLYEAASLPFSLIECGAVSQLLEQSASAFEMGLCQVGDMSLERLGKQLGLTQDRMCLHALAGGAVDSTQLSQWKALSVSYSQTMVEGEL